MIVVATDLDGTFRDGLDPPPVLCISGRTWAEYDDRARAVAQQMPLYIQGAGKFGDRVAAAMFKIRMLNILHVGRYYEDDEFQAEIIRDRCPFVDLVLVR